MALPPIVRDAGRDLKRAQLARNTYSWADDKYELYGEALAKSSFEDFGDSYAVSGTVGFRASW